MPTDLPLIPLEILFGNPKKAGMQLSFDGTRLAYFAPDEGVLNVWVKTVGAEDDRPVTRERERPVLYYKWARNNRHIMYIQDSNGDENYHVFVLDLDSNTITDATPFPNVQAMPLKTSRHHPDTVLLTINKDNVEVHDVYRYELQTGNLTKVVENPGNISDYYADEQLRVRAAQIAHPDGSFTLLVRADEHAPWEPLAEWGPEDAMHTRLLSFSGDGQTVYLEDARGTDTSRLIKIDLASRTCETLVQDSVADLESVVFHPVTRAPLAVSFNRDRIRYHVLDPSIADDLSTVQRISDGDALVLRISDDTMNWLVYMLRDDGSDAYYTYNRSTGQTALLLRILPELDDYQLAKMRPVSFAARDGLTIHGYLTLPVNQPTNNLPLILNVHGGPYHRDTWGYNPEAQWMANRGYACFQVNFRGSTGYGKRHVNAATREWGGKMHDDLVDAVSWAVEQGIADPERVAIYGASYGGYAALVGATFTPDLFCCASAECGPSNLTTFMRTIPPYWSTFAPTLKARVGDPDVDEQFLQARSPLFKAQQIRIPLFIAHGANDPRVNIDETKQLLAALEANGIPHEFMVFPDEGHGCAKPENRLKLYAALEAFFAKHLGGRKL